MNKKIPFYPPELLEKSGEQDSSALVDYRGYTVESFLGAYRKAGPVFRTEVNGLEEVVIGGLEANELAWRNPDQWSYGEAVAVFREELSKVHLTQLDRDPHRRKRRLLNKAFKSSSIMGSLPEIAEQVETGLQSIAGQEVELHQALMRVYTRAQSVSAVKHELSEEMVRKMVDFEEGFIGALFMKDEERALVYNRASYTDLKNEVLGYLHTIVKDRLDGGSAGDLLDLIIHQKTSETMEPLSEEELVYDAYLLQIAGTGNTSKTLCYCLNALSENTEWSERLRAEIGHFDAGAMSRGMKDFPLMKATLMEAERLFPAAPVLPRVPSEEIEFLGYPLAKGAHCLHLVSLMHFDETIYEDPFTFDPQRWLDNDHPKQAHGTFGGGSHVCLGMNVARLQMPLTLGYLLSGFDFEITKKPLVENYAYPGEIDSKTMRIGVKLEPR